MIAKFNSDNTGKRQSLGAWARARFVSSEKPHAAAPKIGPHTTDQTISVVLTVSDGTRYWCSSPRPNCATSAATAEVTTAGTKAFQPNVPNSTSSTNTAPPSGTL